MPQNQPPTDTQGHLFPTEEATSTLNSVPSKTGKSTSEHYITVAINVFCMLYASGVIPGGTMLDRAAAFIMAGLTALGYINSRTKVKTSTGA